MLLLKRVACEEHAQELLFAFGGHDSDITHQLEESSALVSDCSADLKTQCVCACVLGVEGPGDRLN